MTHERSYFRRDAYHAADHDNRGRADPLLSYHAVHLFQC
jgi:hypothetical protein